MISLTFDNIELHIGNTTTYINTRSPLFLEFNGKMKLGDELI